jgi:nucleotide-binding universal stress UspA family protein
MKTILAPTDFSASSIHAVYYAADLAMATNAQLILFTAVQFPVAASEFSLPASAMDEIIDLGNSDLEHLADKIKERTSEKISISFEVMFGSVEQQIELMAGRRKPLAIVMGIKSEKSLEQTLMGNSIFHAMNHVPYPILIIPENLQFSPFREIGLACDLENSGDSLPIENIKEWLSLFNAKLHIVYVTVKEKKFKAEQLSESISLQNHFRFFHPQFHFLEAASLDDKISDFANLQKLDLLIIIPKTYGISQLFHKKHSKQLMSYKRIPILSIHDIPLKKM